MLARLAKIDVLILDENCDVLTCCALSRHNQDYTIGPLAELSAVEIISKKQSRDVCKQCMALNLAMTINSSYVPDFVRDLTLREYGPLVRLSRRLPAGIKAVLKRFIPARLPYLGRDATFYAEKREVRNGQEGG